MLKGHLALITGAGSGIGRAVSQVLSREDCTVIAADKNSESSQETLSLLSSSKNHISLELDVSSRSSVESVGEKILEAYGKPPNVLVNSAGITRDTYLIKMPEEIYDEILDVNLKGTFLCTQMISRMIKESKETQCSIINISSIIGKIGNSGQSAYGASKAGVIGFTKSCSKELARFGIRTNVICPGYIQSPMTEKVPEHIKQMLLLQIPCKKLGVPNDVAEMVAFLASDKSVYMNGAVIDINGGLY